MYVQFCVETLMIGINTILTPIQEHWPKVILVKHNKRTDCDTKFSTQMSSIFLAKQNAEREHLCQ